MNDQPKVTVFERLGHWGAELLLVFLGAYAAFWLNEYQGHREETRRHIQILAALENEVSATIANCKAESVREARALGEFRRAYDAGEMPLIGAINFTTDYSATDLATLLQSGGYQLLDVKTLVALRKAESTVRGGVSTINHAQKLSDDLIVPNLDEDITFFYDPATHKLRKRFAAFPTALESVQRFFEEYAQVETELLKQIQAERQRL